MITLGPSQWKPSQNKETVQSIEGSDLKLPQSDWRPSVPVESTQGTGGSKAVSHPNLPEFKWNPSEPIKESQKSNVNMPNTSWEKVSGIEPPTPIRNFIGLSYMNRFALNDGYATESENMSANEFPSLSVREGYKPIHQNTSSKITGLVNYVDGTFIIIANGYIWTYDPASDTWGTVSTTLNLSVSAFWSYCNFKGNFADYNVLMANGVDPPMRYENGAIYKDLNAPNLLNYICTHDNRVYGAVGNAVYFSALNKAADWSTVNDAGEIVVETNDGKPITGLVPGSQHLLILKDNSLHELYGTNPSNYKIIEVTGKVGCQNNKTVAVVKDLIYFLGNDFSIYAYNGGTLDNKFSLVIQPLLEGMNKAYIDRCCAGTDGIRYFFAFPYGDATENSMLLVYDTRYGTWYSEQYTAFGSWAPCNFIKFKGEFYYGFNDGNIIHRTGTDDNGTPINFSWVSKPFSFSILSAKSNWYRLWVVADVPTGSTLNIYLSPDDEGDSSWTLVKTIAASSNVQSQQIMLPTNIVSNSNFVRVKLDGSGPVKIYEIARQERVLPMGH